MKNPTLVIIDTLGLPYDGNTLSQRGLGGSESWTILFSQELHKLGFGVTVYNACDEEGCNPGIYDGVEYRPLHTISSHSDTHDIMIVSRTVWPYLNRESDPNTPGYNRLMQHAKWKMLWMHDTFLQGDEHLERLLVTGVIDEAVTLSDWHASYIMTCNHGHKRNYEVLKNHIYVSRNGIRLYNTDVDIAKKDPNLFVYNASVSKGMGVLLTDCWPEIKKRIPDAELHVVGGFYRFRESHGPDEQEKKWAGLRDQHHGKNGVHFTGIIKQSEIAELLTKATYFLYPTEFPETFGISTLEAQAYNCVPITTRFGALEEIAIDSCSWKLDYSVTPNSVFPNINQPEQVKKFVDLVCHAYQNKYLTQQKQYYCNNIKDICGWDSVALQFKQHVYATLDWYMPINETREAKYINHRIHEVFGRRMSNDVEWGEYHAPEREIVVISPFWNAEQYISDNINSVAAQDYYNYRHILINDCSEDRSFAVAKQTIEALGELGDKFTLINNSKNVGAVFNQIMTIREHVDNPDAIVILLDGDDKLIANSNVFKYINMLHHRGSEFTYGSCWSMVDNIPLITQPYPEQVKQTKSYRAHRFTWGIPYTHLRTFRKHLLDKVDNDVFKDSDGQWFRAGGDVAIFYNLIEAADPNSVTAVSDILCMYNDANPLNDYKINAAEQTRTATLAKGTTEPMITKRILIAVPTAKYIESDTFKSIANLTVPKGYSVDFEYFLGSNIEQQRNDISEFALKHGYDYLFSVDSDIVLPQDALAKMLSHDKDMVTGMYIQRIPGTHTLEVYRVTPGNGRGQIPYELLKDRGLVEVAGCGFGCVLTKRRVLEGVPQPHFVYHEALNHNATLSEDVYFCMKATNTGYSIWCDTDIKCDHVGSSSFTVD